MIMSLTATFIALLLPPMVFAIAWIISSRSMMNREKSSPFECGFDPLHSARIPFSMRFFLLAVIFLVFDIEIVLLIPIPLLTLANSNLIVMNLLSMLFILILLLGLIHEWNEGSLDWSN